MSKKIDLKKTVQKSILKFNMLSLGDMVVVAVSGGPDSICLLDILADISEETGISLIAAHYNHGLRPAEDDEETLHVKKTANLLNVPFETEKASGLTMNSASLEEKARSLRYDFFERVRVKYNAHKIAMGHNLNDQAETVIMRLLRGSGMAGLSGIPPVRDNVIIRPLIEVNRKDIIDYLEEKSLKYAIDSSNSNSKFLRNKIRLELLPEMIKYQPALIEILGNLSENMRDENSFLEAQADEWVMKNLEKDESGDYLFDIAFIRELPAAFLKRIIRNIIKKIKKSLYGLDFKHIYDVIDLIENSRPNLSIDLPGGLIVKKQYDKLIFSTESSNPESFIYRLENDGELFINETGKKIRIEELDNTPEKPDKDDDKKTALLDKDKLPYPLTIRNFEPGDKFIPLGMTGHKKVKNFFIDLKIPPANRKKIPILLKDNKIAWICGFRIDDQFKVTPETKKILKITID